MTSEGDASPPRSADDSTGESRRLLWRGRRSGPPLRNSSASPSTSSAAASSAVSHPSAVSAERYEATIASLSERIVLLEEALRADRDLSLALSPADIGDRPGPTCFIWDAKGSLTFEHVGEPGLFVRPSVTASRLNAAIDLARSDAIGGHITVDIVQIYGPPRRDLVVVGEALFDHSVAVGSAAHFAGVVVRVIDVTPQRRMDEIRKDFVTNISHELRTPVGAIGVLAEMIAGESSPELRDRMVGRLEVESARLARMIDDLLELAVAEASDPTVSQEFAVMEGVDAALDRIEPGAQAKSISVEVVKQLGPVPPRARGTAPQLASALHNLLDNAVKFSDEGARIVVEVNAVAQKDTVSIAVVDHGVGIPGPDRERIFERFYRVDPARTRGTGGTGLGLSIVRHLVTNMGGTVHVHSIEGHGSTFTIVLPQLLAADSTLS